MSTVHPQQQQETDRQHLQLLSVFHYVLAGMMTISGCFPAIYLVIGVGLLAVSATDEVAPDEVAEMRLVGGLFTGFATVFIAGLWFCASLVFFSGRSLAKRRRPTFCFLVACLLCIFAPLGTVLGVFTIIVLSRPTVKELFQQSVY